MNEEGSLDSKVESWSDDIHIILYNILDNLISLQKIHKDKYLKLKEYLLYFRLPTLIISSINSVMSVGATLFISQMNTSVINCLLSLICGIISAIELFLQLQKQMEIELTSYHQYKLLAIKISTVLKLEPINRDTNGNIFLNAVIADYKSIFENSLVLDNDIIDKLFIYEIQNHEIQNPIKLKSHL